MADPTPIPAGEALAQALLKASGDRIERIDLSGRVLWSNYDVDGVGTPWDERWPEPDRRRAARLVTLAAAGGTPDFEAWRIEADASPRCWSVALRPIPAEAGRPAELLATSRDVTRRAAQAAILAVGGERPAAGTPDVAVIAFDVDGVVVGWDAAASALFGYATEEIVGHSGDVLWTPEDRAAGAPGRERGIAASRGVAPDRRWHMRKGGGRAFVDGAMLARIDERGRPAGYVKVCRDDTARQQTREELVETRRRLESALTAGELGTFDWDLVTDQIRGDPNFQQIFGVTCPPGESLPIAVLLDVLHPDDLPETMARIRGTIERDERYETEYRIRHAGGDVRWVIARGRVERDASGVAVRFTGVVLDITDRKRAEAERQRIADEQDQQARVYQTILSATDDFAYIFDLEGRVLYANRRMLEVWGLTLEQAVGLTLVEIGYPVWHAAMHRREIDEVIRTKRSVRGEIPFTGASGQGGIYDYVFSPVIGPDGNVERVVGTTRDVTERRRADDARRMADARTQFLAEVADATRDLTDPAAVVATVSQRLGEHLGVSRCAHADVAADADAFTIHRDYCNLGVSSCAGTYSLELFGPRAAGDMRGGRTLVVRDVDAELAGPEPVGRATFRAIDISAIICCPLLRGGRLVAMMAVHQTTPRDWTPADVSLVEAVVERTWGYLERARDLRAIAESEARFRQLADAMPQIVWAARGDGTIDYYNRRWFEYTGLPEDEVPGDAGWTRVVPEADAARTVPIWRESLRTGRPHEAECRYRRLDGEFRWHLCRALPVRDGSGAIVRWYGTNTDIHDQKLSEARLADSEARFRQLADAMPQIVFAATPEGVVDYYNRRWYAYTGMAEGPTGDVSWASTLPPEDLASIADVWRRAIESGEPYQNEYRIRRAADGEFRWHLGRALPVRDAEGRIVRWFGTNTDIHDQKVAEVALMESEARLRQLADAMPQIVFAATPDGKVDYFNGKWFDYTGLPRDGEAEDGPLGERHWGPVHTPEGLARAMEAWPRSIATGEPYEIEYALRRRDGQFRWHLGRALPVRDAAGDIVRWYGTNTDIHDQKAAEAALAADKATLEQIAAMAPLPEVLATLARGVESQSASDTVCSILIVNPDGRTLRNGATPGLPESFAAAVEGTPIAPLTGNCGTAAFTRETVHVADTASDPNWANFRGHALEYGLAAGTAMPILRADGTAAGTVCVYYRQPQPAAANPRDLDLLRTAAHLAGIAIEREHAEATVRAALEAERAARAESERAGRMKDEFLATLSHELRTPLSAMLGWSQILRRENTKPDTIRQGLETIERNARAQTQIIDDLLDMSRIISGKVVLDPRPLDLADAVRGAVESVRPTAQGKGVALTLDAGAAAPMVADAGRLQQVFWNLLSNAIKFTPRGGQVAVALDCDASQWRLRVSDSGEGIAPEFLPFVFDRFRQADASTTRRHGGLGLGLAIVKQIVELHGGEASVQSGGIGQGATFTIRLPMPAPSGALPSAPPAPATETSSPPLVHGEPAARAEPAPRVELGAPTWDDRAARQLAGRRVLVVDDEPDARGLLRHLLESCGATVVDAGDAEAGVAAMRAALAAGERIDAIVSDVGMPGENGYAMIARIRALGGAAATLPAIALTAYARAEDRVAALRAGFQMHVPKPVEPAELITTVATLTARAG